MRGRLRRLLLDQQVERVGRLPLDQRVVGEHAEGMETSYLPDLADELLGIARKATSGRAARSTRSGRALSLRQTVLALTEGHGIEEHETNGEETLQVLVGRVRLRSGSEAVELGVGEVVDVPDARHAVDALTDAAVLLTVAVR